MPPFLPVPLILSDGLIAKTFMQVAPEQLEAAREEAERLPAVEITEVDLQWVQVLLFSSLSTFWVERIESGTG